MKFAFAKIIIILGFLFFNLKVLYAEETLQYELTPDKVEMAWVYKIKKGIDKELYEVVVRLNEPNKKFVSQLTGDNIGKRCAIIFEGRTLIKPIIRQQVDSGSIVAGVWNSEEEAKKIVDVLDPQHKGEKFISEHPELFP